MKPYYLLFVILISVQSLDAQILRKNDPYIEPTNELYTKTKQVTQLIHRFNGEENFSGAKLETKDTSYHSPYLRKKYLDNLFDLQSSSISAATKADFISTVLNRNSPQYLSTLSDKWFAQVNTKFIFNGKEEDIALYLKIEKENLGWKWVLTHVYADCFRRFFPDKSSAGGPNEVSEREFLHPLSHELDFMNLPPIFNSGSKQIDYSDNSYSPDYLTILFYEFNKGTLKFEGIESVQFHFLQIENWYFEVTYIERPGNNTGWLISNLMKINDKEKINLVKHFDHE